MKTKTVEYMEKIVRELESTVLKIQNKDADWLIEKILKSKRIFTAGAGRSGLMVKAFAMRLMHIGIESYVAGETITPGIEKGDLLLIGSGSGETGGLYVMAKKAKQIGADLAVITIFSESSIGKLADIIITIPAPTAKVEQEAGIPSVQPKGSLFEQCLLILLEAIIITLMEKMNTGPNIMRRHANLE